MPPPSLHPSIPTHLFPLLVIFFCWRLLVSNNQKPLSVGRISLAPPSNAPPTHSPFSSLAHWTRAMCMCLCMCVCVCCGGMGSWACVCTRVCMLQVACTCTDRGVGCTIWWWWWWCGSVLSGLCFCRQTHGRNDCFYTHQHARAHTPTHTLTKGPGSNVIMPGLAVSQLVKEDTV